MKFQSMPAVNAVGKYFTRSTTMQGYAHPEYAASLSEFGTPRFLPQSGGWILERPVPNSSDLDAMGCYPIFACMDWAALRADLENIGRELISLSLVADPFGEHNATLLRECFGDLVMPFKQHFVVDLSRPAESFVHPHHLRNARRARKKLRVELCAAPLDFLDDWNALYQALVQRHDIRGLAAFSRECFAMQLAVPGMVAFRAAADENTEGMLLWYVQGKVAYYHLGAYSTPGYDLGASFALFSHSIEYFAAQGIEWLNLGAGAGVGSDGESGLNRFKQGWSTGVRTAYFCGRIFDEDKYQELVTAVAAPPTIYFPAYRAGEFG
jgi:hypothetical protein